MWREFQIKDIEDVCEMVERMKNEGKEPWKGFVEAVSGELCPKQM